MRSIDANGQPNFPHDGAYGKICITSERCNEGTGDGSVETSNFISAEKLNLPGRVDYSKRSIMILKAIKAKIKSAD